MQVNDRVLVEYNIPGRAILHERLLAFHLGGTLWVIVTPDFDIYIEDLVVGVDIRALYLQDGGGNWPAGINAANIYAFPVITAAQLANLVGQATAEGTAYLARQAVVPAGAGAPAAVGLGGIPGVPMGAGGGIVGAALARAGNLVVPPAGLAGGGQPLVVQAIAQAQQSDYWVTAENRAGLKCGSVIDLIGKVYQTMGDRGIVEVNGVPVLMLRRAASEAKPTPGIGSHECDDRCFGFQVDMAGTRYIEYKAAIDVMPIVSYPDWPVIGPKTTSWLLRYMHGNGGSPVAFHHRWLAEVRLDYSAQGTAEHLLLCKLIETFINYDGLKVTALAGIELIARKVQMIHERWKHKQPNFSTNNSGGKQTLMDDDSHLLLGTSETRGNVGVSPELQKWLGDELSKEASASKERRKAREERALQQEPPPKK